LKNEFIGRFLPVQIEDWNSPLIVYSSRCESPENRSQLSGHDKVVQMGQQRQCRNCLDMRLVLSAS